MSSKALEPVLTLEEESLPHSWRLANIPQLIGDDGVFVDGDWVESKDQDPNGDVRLIQLADIGDGCYRNKSARFLTKKKSKELRCSFLEKGDVLIARMPDPLGRACIFPGDSKEAVTVVDVAFVRSGNDEFSHKWLMYFVNAPAFRAAVASLQSGTTRKRISRKNLSRVQLPVPPRDQQDRIVEEIEKQFSRLDEAVANLKRVKANLKRYKAAVLKAAVEGKLTEEWRKQNPDVEPASKLLERILTERRKKWEEAELAKMKERGKESKDCEWKEKYKGIASFGGNGLPEIPINWSSCQLGALIVEGPQNGLYLPKSAYKKGIGILRIDDFQDGYTRSVEELKQVETSDENISKYGLIENDIVINRVNSPSHLGKCMVVLRKNLPSLFESNMMRLRVSTFIHPRFIEIYLQSSNGRRRLLENAKWAVNQASINQGDVSSTTIPVPTFAEQCEIVSEWERRETVFEQLELQIETEGMRMTRLRQSILAAAFTGNVLSIGDAQDAHTMR